MPGPQQEGVGVRIYLNNLTTAKLLYSFFKCQSPIGNLSDMVEGSLIRIENTDSQAREIAFCLSTLLKTSWTADT